MSIQQQAETTNSNNTPVQAGEITPKMQLEITALVQAEVENRLYHGVQCVTADAAAHLLSVEPGTIRDWIKCGKLPASKPGNVYLILVNDINSMLKKYATIVPMKIDKRRNAYANC